MGNTRARARAARPRRHPRARCTARRAAAGEGGLAAPSPGHAGARARRLEWGSQTEREKGHGARPSCRRVQPGREREKEQEARPTCVGGAPFRCRRERGLRARPAPADRSFLGRSGGYVTTSEPVRTVTTRTDTSCANLVAQQPRTGRQHTCCSKLHAQSTWHHRSALPDGRADGRTEREGGREGGMEGGAQGGREGGIGREGEDGRGKMA